MLTLKDSPVGIDIVINEINSLVYNEVNFDNYNAYHRCFKQDRDGGLIPEAFVYDSSDYQEVFYDDNVNSSFFYTSDTINLIDNGRLAETTISMVFQLDLSNVSPLILHRGDEEIHRMIINAINESSYGSVVGVTTGISNVYSEFDQSQITYTDMHPFHCFRVDIDVSYQLGCCTDCISTDEKFLADVDGNYITFVGGYKILLHN